MLIKKIISFNPSFKSLHWNVELKELFNKPRVGDDSTEILFTTPFIKELAIFLRENKERVLPHSKLKIILQVTKIDIDYQPILDCLSKCQKSGLYDIDLSEILTDFNINDIKFSIELKLPEYNISELSEKFKQMEDSIFSSLLEITDYNLDLIDASLVSLKRGSDGESIVFSSNTKSPKHLYIGSMLSDDSWATVYHWLRQDESRRCYFTNKSCLPEPISSGVTISDLGEKSRKFEPIKVGMRPFIKEILENKDLYVYSSKMNPGFINSVKNGKLERPEKLPYFQSAKFSYAILNESCLDISNIRHQIQEGYFKFIYMTHAVYNKLSIYGPILKGREKIILICDDNKVHKEYSSLSLVKKYPELKSYLDSEVVLLRLIYLENLLEKTDDAKEVALKWGVFAGIPGNNVMDDQLPEPLKSVLCVSNEKDEYLMQSSDYKDYGELPQRGECCLGNERTVNLVDCGESSLVRVTGVFARPLLSKVETVDLSYVDKSEELYETLKGYFSDWFIMGHDQKEMLKTLAKTLDRLGEGLPTNALLFLGESGSGKDELYKQLIKKERFYKDYKCHDPIQLNPNKIDEIIEMLLNPNSDMIQIINIQEINLTEAHTRAFQRLVYECRGKGICIIASANIENRVLLNPYVRPFLSIVRVKKMSSDDIVLALKTFLNKSSVFVKNFNMDFDELCSWLASNIKQSPISVNYRLLKKFSEACNQLEKIDSESSIHSVIVDEACIDDIVELTIERHKHNKSIVYLGSCSSDHLVNDFLAELKAFDLKTMKPNYANDTEEPRLIIITINKFTNLNEFEKLNKRLQDPNSNESYVIIIEKGVELSPSIWSRILPSEKVIQKTDFLTSMDWLIDAFPRYFLTKCTDDLELENETLIDYARKYPDVNEQEKEPRALNKKRLGKWIEIFNIYGISMSIYGLVNICLLCMVFAYDRRLNYKFCMDEQKVPFVSDIPPFHEIEYLVHGKPNFYPKIKPIKRSLDPFLSTDNEERKLRELYIGSFNQYTTAELPFNSENLFFGVSAIPRVNPYLFQQSFRPIPEGWHSTVSELCNVKNVKNMKVACELSTDGLSFRNNIDHFIDFPFQVIKKPFGFSLITLLNNSSHAVFYNQLIVELKEKNVVDAIYHLKDVFEKYFKYSLNTLSPIKDKKLAMQGFLQFRIGVCDHFATFAAGLLTEIGFRDIVKIDYIPFGAVNAHSAVLAIINREKTVFDVTPSESSINRQSEPLQREQEQLQTVQENHDWQNDELDILEEELEELEEWGFFEESWKIACVVIKILPLLMKILFSIGSSNIFSFFEFYSFLDPYLLKINSVLLTKITQTNSCYYGINNDQFKFFSALTIRRTVSVKENNLIGEGSFDPSRIVWSKHRDEIRFLIDELEFCKTHKRGIPKETLEKVLRDLNCLEDYKNLLEAKEFIYLRDLGLSTKEDQYKSVVNFESLPLNFILNPRFRIAYVFNLTAVLFGDDKAIFELLSNFIQGSEEEKEKCLQYLQPIVVNSSFEEWRQVRDLKHYMSNRLIFFLSGLLYTFSYSDFSKKNILVPYNNWCSIRHAFVLLKFIEYFPEADLYLNLNISLDNDEESLFFFDIFRLALTTFFLLTTMQIVLDFMNSFRMDLSEKMISTMFYQIFLLGMLCYSMKKLYYFELSIGNHASSDSKLMFNSDQKYLNVIHTWIILQTLISKILKLNKSKLICEIKKPFEERVGEERVGTMLGDVFKILQLDGISDMNGVFMEDVLRNISPIAADNYRKKVAELEG